MTTYQALLRQLSVRTQRELGQLVDRHTRGDLSRARFLTLGAGRIAVANHRATSLADVALAAAVMAAVREPTRPLGLRPESGDQVRLAGALSTVLDDRPESVDPDVLPESQRARVERLAGNEPLLAASDAYRIGMVARATVVTGWVRASGPGACQLCRAWAGGGPFPPDAPMARHVGCACVQQIVTTRSAA